MDLQVEPSEKRKKTKNSSPPPSLPSSSPSFSLLPDEITVSYLAQISISYYPRLSIVSKSFRSLISSLELYAARSHLGRTEQCFYVCLWDHRYRISQWFRLWINPNRTLPNDKTTGQLLVPIASSDFPCVPKSTVSVGSDIYFIGGPIDKSPSSTVRILDCRRHSWRDGPRMHVSRKNASTCVHDGKIYVMGGCEEDESWAEVFDTKTQTWERLSDPGTEIRKFSVHGIGEMQGKIYFWNSENMYAYDTKQCAWECCEDKWEKFVGRLQSVAGLRSYFDHNGAYKCSWYDIKVDGWKEVKGLDSVGKKYKSYCGSGYNIAQVVGCSGKFFVFWDVYMRSIKRNPNDKNEIWGAEIELEKRDGGEVWGKANWFDVVHTVPPSCRLLHCLAVSV